MEPMSRRLHIGGRQVRVRREILDGTPGPHMNHLGSTIDLDRPADAGLVADHASKMLEPLDGKATLAQARHEAHRVPAPAAVAA